MQSFFVWNGVDCRSMGIILRGPVSIVRPEERVNHVQIPGRSGDLTETEGDNIFNSYIQTAEIQVASGFWVHNVYKWLRGAGYVTFSGEPDKRQKARIIGAVTLNKLSHNLDIWAGEVQFYCQPFKERLYEAPIEITSSGTKVINMGDVVANPILKVTASTSTVVVSSGGKTITCTDYTSGQKLLIDSEVFTIYNEDQTADWTKWSSGDFPVLAPGANTVTGSGWSKIELTKRERFL